MTPLVRRSCNSAARLTMLRYDLFQAGALHASLFAEAQGTWGE